jgi:transcriptional regulator with XRE-family HTH domain
VAPFLRLKYERLRRQLSQFDLATKANIPRPYISHFEKGRMTPTEDELFRLANVLLVSPPSILLKPCVLADPEPEENNEPKEVGA